MRPSTNPLSELAPPTHPPATAKKGEGLRRRKGDREIAREIAERKKVTLWTNYRRPERLCTTHPHTHTYADRIYTEYTH